MTVVRPRFTQGVCKGGGRWEDGGTFCMSGGVGAFEQSQLVVLVVFVLCLVLFALNYRPFR